MQRLYNTDGSAVVRTGLAAADLGTWLPTDPSGLDVLDAREWEDVQVTPIFRDVAGEVTDGTSVSITPLIAVYDAAAGKVWRELTAVAGLTDNVLATIPSRGHEVSFRVTTIVLGTAITVDIVVVSGTRDRARVT
jgi:hypothetical protein